MEDLYLPKRSLVNQKDAKKEYLKKIKADQKKAKLLSRLQSEGNVSEKQTRTGRVETIQAKRAASNATFGEPYKIIRHPHNGMILPLYTAETVRKIIGKKYADFLVIESRGLFPKAKFMSGKKRYYSVWEVIAVQEAVALFGRPRFSRVKEIPFVTYLRKRWDDIRESLDRGEEPEVSIYVFFKSKEDAENFFAEILRSEGIVSPSVTAKLVDGIYRRSIMIG